MSNLAKLPQRVAHFVSGKVQKIRDTRSEYSESISGELNLFTDEEIESDEYRVFDPDLPPEEVAKIQNRAKELRQRHRSVGTSTKHGNR